MSDQRDERDNKKSYIYIHNFLTRQINLMTKPLEINMEDFLSYLKQEYNQSYTKEEERKIMDMVNKKLLPRVNARVSSYYKSIYSKQAINKISLQILNYEESLKEQGLRKVTKSHEFLVPLILNVKKNSLNDDVSKLCKVVEQLPDIKYFYFKQLNKITNTELLNEEEDKKSDDLVVLMDDELKRKLRQYQELQKKLLDKRKAIEYRLQKLNYYKQLNNKVVNELFGGLNPKEETNIVNNIQKNILVSGGSNNEFNDELIKLRISLGKLIPNIRSYNDEKIVDLETNKELTIKDKLNEQRTEKYQKLLHDL